MWVTQDTMVCNLPEHSKTQPIHPNPMGPPLDYMVKCKVFDYIQSDLYDLCCFYALGTTGNPPDFPSPQEPVTCNQVRDLLKSTRSIGCPYMILVHSTDSMTTMSMLWELHTAACLRHLQVDLHDKSVKMSLCPFCTNVGMNDSVLLKPHYHSALQCQLWVQKVLKAGICLVFCSAQPQKSVPWV